MPVFGVTINRTYTYYTEIEEETYGAAIKAGEREADLLDKDGFDDPLLDDEIIVEMIPQ